MVFTKVFWKDVLERSITTAAQVLIALMTVDGFSLLSADWSLAVAAVVTAVILEILKGIVAASSQTTSISPASLAKDSEG